MSVPPALDLWSAKMPDYGPRKFEWEIVWCGYPPYPEIRITCEFAHRQLDGKLSRIISLREELNGTDPDKLSQVTDSIIAILADGGELNRVYFGIPAGGALRANQIVLRH